MTGDADVPAGPRQILNQLRDGPKTKREMADQLPITGSTIKDHICELRERGYTIRCGPDYAYHLEDAQAEGSGDLPDLSVVETDADPEESELTGRERVILSEIQQGATIEELTDRVDDRASVVTQHLRDLKQSGWDVYIDESSEQIAIEGDHTLRSSEHKGTRTRKANKWWELRHNELVREYKTLPSPSVDAKASDGDEDWVTHMTDLHAGDEVRGYDDSVIHSTDDIVPIIDYITRRSLNLAEKHGSSYDTGYLLYGGDMITNESIYEGQFESLDAWLDEQLDRMHDPLLAQIKAFAESFDQVRVVCQAGNHGEIRASGSSKQANADIILYKGLRNTVAALQEVGYCENVGFKIGRAGSPTPFRLRDGEIHGHLRHGQDRSPQADTSARKKEWLSTLLDSANYGDEFDIAWMGHHHVSGRVPWNGPPIIISGSPKPAGDYPRELGEVPGPNTPDIATCHGVADDGITGIFPVDTRDLE